MGNLISGKKSKSDTENNNDFLFIDYFNKFKNEKSNLFDFSSFNSDLFLNLNPKLLEFLNDFNNKNTKKSKKTRMITKDNFDLSEFRLLFNLLTNNNNFLSNEDDIGYIYYRKNSFYMLYDIIRGKVGASQEETMDFKIIIDIFDYIVELYIKKHNQSTNYNKSQVEKFLRLNNITQADSTFSNFIDHTLYSLDSFLKNIFKLKFLSKKEDVNLLTAPVSSEFSSILTIPQFLFFTMANSLIYPKRFAFKLYNCKVNGYNILSLIYSFIGFPGPIAIFIEHYEKEENKMYILGAFLNSNFRECYEKYCGDDLSFVFTISPELKFYKFQQKPDKICFISSKTQKYSKAQSGIGLGHGYDKFKLWLDGGDLFNKSYLEKYDDVFEEGTPFKELKHFLKITNIEVFGFGSKDDYDSLIKKQNRDENISEKMKKVDKAAFLEGDFNKEMFFENTFGHKYDK